MEGAFFLIPAQCETTSRMKMCSLTSETCSRDEILMLADGSSKHLEMLAWWMITGLYLHWRLKCWTRFMAAPLKCNICDCTIDSRLMWSMSCLSSKERLNTRGKKAAEAWRYKPFRIGGDFIGDFFVKLCFY